MMALMCSPNFQNLFPSLVPENGFSISFGSGVNLPRPRQNSSHVMRRNTHISLSFSKSLVLLPPLHHHSRMWSNGGSSNAQKVKSDDGDDLMDEDERQEWRKKIREVIDKYPDVEVEMDPEEKRKRMQKLLAEYPLVVEEEDPDWPEDADGRGFNMDQFFNKISIKNVKKDKDVDDDNYDSDKEIVWQDDDYIRPIKDISASEWEVAVFKDISPLVVLVHNRYRRPKENERCRDELEKAVNIIWNCRLPSPRCVAIDAVVDDDLASALKVSIFPELIFTKAGKILYREKESRSADELSKIMAFFYFGAAKPSFLNSTGNSEEAIPSVPNVTDPQ